VADVASLDFAPSAALPDIATAAPAETDFSATFIGGGEAGGNLLEFELDEAPVGTETVVNPQFLNQALNGETGTETLVSPLIIEGLEVGPGDTGAAFPTISGEPALADDMAGMSLEYAAPEGFEISLDDVASGEGALPVPEFDMTSINLDLGAEPAMQAISEPVADEGEAGTKFALAQAYEEMGDRDQARELLEEVIAEGSGNVVARAKEMLERLRG
jgi:pilus assembly protein FimV